MKTPEDILAKLEAKQAAKIAALTPKERADLDRRQAARLKHILEEVKKKDPDFLRLEAALDGAFVVEELENKSHDAFRISLEKIFGEYTQDEIDAFLSKCRDALYTYLDEKDDDLANMESDNKVEKQKRLAGQTSKANKLARELKTVMSELARLRGNDIK